VQFQVILICRHSFSGACLHATLSVTWLIDIEVICRSTVYLKPFNKQSNTSSSYGKSLGATALRMQVSRKAGIDFLEQSAFFQAK